MGEPEDDEPKRLSYLVSALVHSAIILVLISLRFSNPETPRPEAASPRIVQRVRLVPPRPPEHISVGPPSSRRQKELVLERDVEITHETPRPGPPGPEGAAPTEDRRLPDPVTTGGKDLLSEDAGASVPLPAPRPESSPVVAGPAVGGMRRTLQNLDARIGTGEAGLARGGGLVMGGLQFDPRGADFTLWINHLRREVYRNWITPQTALLGFAGHVDIEFVVNRDGTLASLSILKGTGMVSMDRAAANSLLASRLLPLPSDYGPATLTINATFTYGRFPQHS